MGYRERPPTRITIPDTPQDRGTRGRKAPAPADPDQTARWSLLFAPLFLIAIAVGFGIVLSQPVHIFGWVLGGLLLACLGWIVISALWPSSADRRCPECGSESLVRLDSGSTTGVACEACGHRDESQSAFYLAEEEGPLEEIVLAQRAQRRRERGGVRKAPAPGRPAPAQETNAAG